MKEISFKSLSIRQVINLLEMNLFAIPEIQREFVWDGKKACFLFDSIYRNYPIGTIMVWDTERNNRNLLRHKYHILPLYDDKNKNIYFLIDGQQRLSVLYQILHGEKIHNSKRKEVDFGRIYFNLWEDESDVRFEYTKRPDQEKHVRLCDLLHIHWFKKAGIRNLPKYKLKVIKDCRDKILKYKLHMIFLKSNSNALQEVRETFIRINSSGMVVTAAERAFARATDLKLLHLVKEIKDKDSPSRLNYGFDLIPDETILMTIALASGAKEVGEKGIQKIIKLIEKSHEARRRFDHSWRHLKEAIGKAVDYIVLNFKVLNYGFLPSRNMVTTLALFFFYNNNAQPNNAQKKQIKRWFWSTAIAQRYAGEAFRRNILKDTEFFKKLGRNKKGRFDLEEKVPVYKLKQANYAKRSGITDATYCLLVLQKPKYLINGGRMPISIYSTLANRSNKHHIFPNSLLRANGFSKEERNSICNICFLDAQTNQSFGNKKPVSYLNELKPKKIFSSIMKSHLIPYSQDCGLWENNIKRGYKIFLNERAKLLVNKINNIAATKIFRTQ